MRSLVRRGWLGAALILVGPALAAPAPDRFAATLRTRARIKARLAPQLAAALAASSS